MAGEDFVKVKLSAAGVKFANGGPVRIVDGQHTFEFEAGQVREDITRAFDWPKVLKNASVDGEPLFELVDEDE